MNPEQAAALRKPFDDESISLLPKLSCSDCANTKGTKTCGKHQKAKCKVCNAWISSAHIHLSYVGHAETTDRFLEVDPEWTWEPMAYDQNGLPAFDGNGGLWMWLTIAGVRKPGYGDAQGKQGPNAVKEAIGDGLRNAGMRFGVALALWAKSDLASLHADKETGDIVNPAANGHAPEPTRPKAERGAISTPTWQRLVKAARALKWTQDDLMQDFAAAHDGQALDKVTDEIGLAYADKLDVIIAEHVAA